MKYLNLIKEQKLIILTLIFLVLIPYYLICIYLPKIPYMHYFFILGIFVIKLLVFNDQVYKNQLKSKVQKTLNKETGKNPSQTDIFKRIDFLIKGRNFLLLLTAIGVLAMAIFFRQL